MAGCDDSKYVTDYSSHTCLPIDYVQAHYTVVPNCQVGHISGTQNAFECDLCEDGYWYRPVSFIGGSGYVPSYCYPNSWMGVTGEDVYPYGVRRRNLCGGVGEGVFVPIEIVAPLTHDVGNLKAGTLFTYRNYTECSDSQMFIDPNSVDFVDFLHNNLRGYCQYCDDLCNDCIWDYGQSPSVYQCIDCDYQISTIDGTCVPTCPEEAPYTVENTLPGSLAPMYWNSSMVRDQNIFEDVCVAHCPLPT